MPRRQKPKPDTRPNWRDPNLPIWIAHLKRWATPEQMQLSAQRGIDNPFVISWRDDPTYNLKAKHK